MLDVVVGPAALPFFSAESLSWSDMCVTCCAAADVPHESVLAPFACALSAFFCAPNARSNNDTCHSTGENASAALQAEGMVRGAYHGWRDGWMDGWRRNGWMDGWMDARIE